MGHFVSQVNQCDILGSYGDEYEVDSHVGG
jgi:hypothetical protein